MKNLIDKIILLLSVSFLCLLFSVCALFSIQASMRLEKEIASKTESVRAETEHTERTTHSAIVEVKGLMHRINRVPLSIKAKRVILYDAHKMFITAYCAEECGWSYSTSSGAECHRSDWTNRYEPTTCAIDRSYFRYGTMFYIPSEDRVYIAEDTGPGVRGKWIDTYQNDMSDVTGYNTRYEICYTCDVEDYSKTLYSKVSVQDVICNINVTI